MINSYRYQRKLPGYASRNALLWNVLLAVERGRWWRHLWSEWRPCV